jgi:hypothetical protein
LLATRQAVGEALNEHPCWLDDGLCESSINYAQHQIKKSISYMPGQ